MHVYPLAASRPGGCIVFDTRQQRTVTDMSKLVYVPSPALSRSSSILGRWAIWHVVTAFSGLVHSEQSFLHHSVFFFSPLLLWHSGVEHRRSVKEMFSRNASSGRDRSTGNLDLGLRCGVALEG